MARLSKPLGIYCSPEKWERIRRRAHKAGMKNISRFGVLCCQQAGKRDAVPPPAPAGYPLVLSEGEQHRLRADIEAHAQSSRIAVRGPGDAKVTVRLDEVLAILRMCDPEDGA